MRSTAQATGSTSSGGVPYASAEAITMRGRRCLPPAKTEERIASWMIAGWGGAGGGGEEGGEGLIDEIPSGDYVAGEIAECYQRHEPVVRLLHRIANPRLPCGGPPPPTPGPTPAPAATAPRGRRHPH